MNNKATATAKAETTATAKAAIEQSSKSKVSSKQILSMDLDKLNATDLQAILQSNAAAKAAKQKQEKYNLSAYNARYNEASEKIDKAERRKIRNERNELLNAIIKATASEDKSSKAAAIKAFNAFFNALYTSQDMSIENIAGNNADEATKAIVKIALYCMK